MSSSKQLQDFDLQFVQESMREWSNLAQVYEREAEKVYTKLRSYLTFHQFRLDDQQKCEIREMLSQDLDELEKVNLIEDMDNYLDGFCFKLDKSILPKRQPTEVKIQIAPEPELAQLNHEDLSRHAPIKPTTFEKIPSPHSAYNSVFNNNPPLSPAFDNAVDVDIYELMFNS